MIVERGIKMNRILIWLVKSGGITPSKKNLDELASRRDLFDPATVDINSKEYAKAEKELEKAEKMGCSVVIYPDKMYPECLRDLPRPPAVLYVRGNVSVLNGIVYAGIVGSRKCDAYGVQMASEIAREIGSAGAGIVSGGAEGVDGAAHDGALRVNAPTIAVMGSGLDIIYPPCNKELFKRIENAGGAVISEFPFGTPPRGKNFPYRNRIIAAMSTVVVLVRAAKNSGGLITVEKALSMNKTVFAVPGNIDNRLSMGANELIRDGAVPLLSPMDAIDELIAQKPDYFVKTREEIPYVKAVPEVSGKNSKNNGTKIKLSEYESEIVSIIENGFDTQNLIEEKISFDASRLTALLGMMEIKGIIRKKADKRYIVNGGKC